MSKFKLRYTGQWHASGFNPDATPGPDVNPPELVGSITLVALVGGFRISGTFNETCTLEVQYGLTTSYGTTVSSTPSQGPSRQVTGLTNSTLYHVRWRAFDALNNYTGWSTDLTVTTNAPAPTSDFTHGDEIFRWNVGRADGFYEEDTRTVLASPTTYTGSYTMGAAQANTTWDNYRFTSNLTIGAGATNVTFTNCHFETPSTTVGGNYTFRVRDGGIATVQDSTFLGSHYNGKTIYVHGTGSGLMLQRCLILGGEDVIHIGGLVGALPFPDYECDDFTGARVVVEDSYISDTTRLAAGHTDCFQVDGDSGNTVLKRCKLMAYYLIQPDKPRAQEATPQANGNACHIATYGASTTQQLRNLGLYDCRVNGGNYVTYMAAGDGPNIINGNIRRCHYGAEQPFSQGGHDDVVMSYRFGVIATAGTDIDLSDNTWALTGKRWNIDKNQFVNITAGDPVPVGGL
jgi:hypothetical protein